MSNKNPLQSATIIQGPGNRQPFATPSPFNPIRSYCYLEAVRAVSIFCEPGFKSPPHAELLELLDASFDNIAQERTQFSPEDFAAYFMSILLNCCVSDQEMEAIRSGAKEYMSSVLEKLSEDLAQLVSNTSSEPKHSRNPRGSEKMLPRPVQPALDYTHSEARRPRSAQSMQQQMHVASTTHRSSSKTSRLVNILSFYLVVIIILMLVREFTQFVGTFLR